MDFSAEPIKLTYLDGSMTPRSESHRSKDILHVSQVYRDLSNRVINVGKRSSVMTPAQEQQMGYYVEVGFSWEAMLEQEFKKRMGARFNAMPQQEYRIDGLALTPDNVVLGDYVILHEYKATWKSERRLRSKNDLQRDFWEWYVQIGCYLNAIGANICELYVFWVNGDYEGKVPKAFKYTLVYSDEEIRDLWDMVLAHAETMRSEGITEGR